MNDDYISLQEASRFEGLAYYTFKARINRHASDYQTEQRPNPNGGKPLVYVAVSSLTVRAQRLFKAQTQPPQKKANVPDAEPWYLTADYNWYKAKYPEHLSEAEEIAKDIDQYHNKMKSGQFEAYMSEKYGKNTRHIRRYIKSYYEGLCFAHNKEIETGENYDYLRILAVSQENKAPFQASRKKQKFSLKTPYTTSSLSSTGIQSAIYMMICLKRPRNKAGTFQATTPC